MKEYRLKYGKGEQSITLDESKVLQIIDAEQGAKITDLKQAVLDAIRNPVGSAPLREVVKAGDKVVILVSDITRAWTKTSQYLPIVVEELNNNGVPDDDEWYEIAGSAHNNPEGEAWYQMAVNAGNDVNTYKDYQITYYRPEKEPTTAEEKEQYIRWEDNQGNSGYKVKNSFHNQPYFPQLFEGEKLTFNGTCLPQNGIDESGKGTYFVLYKFGYGYADNEQNTKDDACIDIDWAVNSKGQKVNLPGVDYIKIYCGVNQENSWLGECSTEVSGVEDLHILGEEVATRED